MSIQMDAEDRSRPAGPAAPIRPSIAVVLLTWNGRDDTLCCLRSLVPQLGDDDRVWVLDNASADGTEPAVRAAFAEIDFVQNGGNLGFAAGNNPGLRSALNAGFDWILLLNNDTVLPPGALRELRDLAGRASSEVGVLQPLLVRDAEPERVDSAGHELGRLPGVRDLAAGRAVAALPAGPIEVFGACGAAALFRRGALTAAGLLDERLFVLFEDVDLMFRIRLRGFTVMLAPSIRIRHRRGVSGGGRSRDATARRRRRAWVQRNIVTIAIRYWPTAALCVSAPAILFRSLQALTAGARSGVGGCVALWRDAWRSRAANRRAMRALGVDRWFGRRPLG